MNDLFSRPGRRGYLLLFLALNLLYHSNLRPIASGDSLPAALTPIAMLLDGSPRLDRFAGHLNSKVWYAGAVLRESGGHWYSVYPIAGPLLTTPLYAPLLLVPGVRQMPAATLVSLARIVEKPVAVVLASGAVLLMLATLLWLLPAREAWIGAAAFAVGTGVWSTASQALWQHTYGLPALVGFFYALVRLADARTETRWAVLAGLCAGLAIAIRPTNAALLPALLAALALLGARRFQWMVTLLALAAPAAAAVAWNLSVFGRISGGYPAALQGNAWEGLTGLLLSPGRGLLIYTPLAVLALPVVPAVWKQAAGRAALCFSAGHLAVLSLWPVWWGGYCWGPRMLTELLPALAVLCALGWPQVSRFRGAFAATALYGVLIQSLGVYCYPKGRWDHLPLPVDTHPGRLWDFRDNPVVRTARGGLAWEPYAVVGAAINGGIPAAAKRLEELGIQPQ